MASSTSFPSPEVLTTAAALNVYDDTGNEVSFGSLIKDQKTIVVFIRHFWCGSCQQYVIQLASVRKEALEQASARLVVIGCGDWKLIKEYCGLTDFKGGMYADPSRKLYHAFGLIETLDRTPDDQEKRSYLGKSFIGNLVSSIWEGPLKHPQHLGKQGHISQLGGDFVFGPGETCTYASRMKHTEDHVEVEELMKEAAVAYP
ncbi:AhpC/TSA antioxidant enzyme-domain-containing protein [Ganoderma leucocontextum]|nr:AhpC/TSA antioxidant enzyme-domain-containing protein [Ganoderma leucocontextum]